MAKTTETVDPTQLSLPEDEQDAVVFGLLTNADLLTQCQRRQIKGELFLGEARQLVVGRAMDYFGKYSMPAGTTIMELFEEARRRKKIHPEKAAMVDQYLLDLLDRYEARPSEYLLDRLDDFVKKRVAFTAATDIMSLMGTVAYEPERILNIMRGALDQLDECTCKALADDLREDDIVAPTSDLATRFNVECLDRALDGGLHMGQFVVIQAYTNRGKSWSIAHLAKHAVRIGTNTLVVPTEMANRVWRLRWKQTVAGMSRSDVTRNPKAYRDARGQVFRRNASLYLLTEEEKSMPVDQLAAAVKDIEQRNKRQIKLILLDSADDLEPPKPKEGQRYLTKIDRSTAIYTWLKNFAKQRNICIATTSQSQRIGERKYWLTSGTIGDDINKVRKAHVGVSLNAQDGELQKGLARWLLFKNTDGPVGMKCWVRNDYERGRVAYYSQEYNHEDYKEMLKKEGVVANETT